MAKEMAEYLNIITGMDNLEELKILMGSILNGYCFD